mmetsp:Transcript_14518/g.31530  ORF Transcript_14518/g.31530 Transcript_14518/m.31530 type:complete len:204 (+) Transcript_14518:725-1336(+)
MHLRLQYFSPQHPHSEVHSLLHLSQNVGIGRLGISYGRVNRNPISPNTSLFILLSNSVDVHGVGSDPKWKGFQHDGPHTTAAHSEAGRTSASFSCCLIRYLKWRCAISGIRCCSGGLTQNIGSFILSANFLVSFGSKGQLGGLGQSGGIPSTQEQNARKSVISSVPPPFIRASKDAAAPLFDDAVHLPAFSPLFRRDFFPIFN